MVSSCWNCVELILGRFVSGVCVGCVKWGIDRSGGWTVGNVVGGRAGRGGGGVGTVIDLWMRGRSCIIRLKRRVVL